MRIISQKGTVDVQYERVILRVSKKGHRIIANQMPFTKDSYDFVLGEYSTKDKALKVMEQIRFANLLTLSATNCDLESFAKSAKETNIMCKGISIRGESASINSISGEIFFQMPKDTEVEE